MRQTPRSSARHFQIFLLGASCFCFQLPVSLAAYAQVSVPQQTYTHRVEQDQNLWQIALLRFGHVRYVEKIAAWNQLSRDSKLKPGQELVLREKPLPAAKGSAILLQRYRSHFGLTVPAPAQQSGFQEKRTQKDQKTQGKKAPSSVSGGVEGEPFGGNPFELQNRPLSSGASQSPQVPRVKETPPLKKEAFLAALARAEAEEEGLEGGSEEAPTETPEEIQKEFQEKMQEGTQVGAQGGTPSSPRPHVSSSPRPRASSAPRPLSASQLFERGKIQFEKKEFERALESFRMSRSKDEEPVHVWLFEIRTLRELKRSSETAETIAQFVKKYPEFAELPVLKLEAESP